MTATTTLSSSPGAGEAFCASQATGGWPALTARTWDKIFTEGRRLLENLLAIEVPMIAAINGPALWHAELGVLCDIVLASDDVVFQDAPHLPHAVPGDGVHNVWPALLGAEPRPVLPPDEAEARRGGGAPARRRQRGAPEGGTARARVELARMLAVSDPLTLKYTRLALTQKLKRAVLDDLALGLAMEGLAALRT